MCCEQALSPRKDSTIPISIEKKVYNGSAFFLWMYRGPYQHACKGIRKFARELNKEQGKNNNNGNDIFQDEV